MNKLLLNLFVSLLFCNFAYTQSDLENLDKYWSYRDRLRKDFLKIGNLRGESIPMTSRRIDWAFQNQNDSPWPEASAVYYSDATIYLGHYLMLLATEYRLTSNQLQTETPGTEQYEKLTAQKQQNLSELYYAIATLNRLDNKAEAYLENVQGIPQPNDINGYLLRDDVPEDFYLNFLSDYSQLFNRDANFLFTDSDYYAFPEYPNDPDDEWEDISLDQMQNIPNEAERTFNPGNYMSLDQITTIFTGLRCVFDLVDPILVQPTAEDSPMNLREEARAIVFRILDYIVNEETCPGSDPCYSFQIKDLQGRIKRAGSDLSLNAPFIFSIGRHFNYPLFNEWVSDGLNEIRVALMIDSPELKEMAETWDLNTVLDFDHLIKE